MCDNHSENGLTITVYRNLLYICTKQVLTRKSVKRMKENTNQKVYMLALLLEFTCEIHRRRTRSNIHSYEYESCNHVLSYCKCLITLSYDVAVIQWITSCHK